MHFDRMTRTLTDAFTRRSVLTRLGGAAFAAVALQLPGVAEAKKKKRKKCGPCRTKKKGKCKGTKPDDTACNGDGKCFAGACIPRPTCLASASACTQPAAGACCSGICSAAHGDLCLFSDIGEPCYTGSDCNGAPLTPCIAYRCR